MSSTSGTESSASINIPSSIDIPPEHCLPKRRETGGTVHGGQRNEFWRKRNLLSLDGGGIRGYWTLLVLQRLEEYVYHEECEQAKSAGETDHAFRTKGSFEPERYPKNVSQLSKKSGGKEKGKKIIPANRAVLLCHYFDLICGTSTGSLIAIMLGRFRMTVGDCLEEYKRMGHYIFGSPRLISQRNLGLPWPKYDERGLEAALLEVTLRRCEKPSTKHFADTPTFAMTTGTCQTFVTTIRRTKNPNGAEPEDHYLIRSYNHEERPTPDQALNSGMTPPPEINWGAAEVMKIPQVARAATAAPMYFKEMKDTSKVGAKGQEYFFSDAGFSELNNPTKVGLQELKTLPGPKDTGAIVNVGTSRSKPEFSAKSVVNLVKRMAGKATDPKIVADQMKQLNLEHYWRFNDDGGINIDLDEWKPNHWFTPHERRGQKTLEKMEHKFDRWAGQTSNIDMLKACAKELVVTRRGRCKSGDKSRWEQFALAAHSYHCSHEQCGSDAVFNSRYQFEQHWSIDHDDDVLTEPLFRKWVYQEAPEMEK